MLCCDKVQQQSQKKSKEVPLLLEESPLPHEEDGT
jgi:hypothetical protein